MTELEAGANEPSWLHRNWVLCGAIVLTVGWSIAAYVMLQFSVPCEVEGKIVGLLNCRTSNEIGDLLAGLFSPVAFVWLVAAVLMQSSELRAQREELSLTRREYELTRMEVEAQRKALEAQVIETKKNVEFIGEQTAILKDERVRAEIEATDIRISTLVEIIAKRFSGDFSNVATTVRHIPGGLLPNEWKSRLGVQISPGSPFDIMKSGIKSLESLVEDNKDLNFDSFEVTIGSFEFASMVDAQIEIDDLVNNCSARMTDQLNYANFWHLQYALQELTDFLKTKSPEWHSAYEEHLQNMS